MGRHPIHPEESIMDAARTLVLDKGIRATTVNAISELSGAPKGSIYYRFLSLHDLLASVWLRAAKRSQEAFLLAIRETDPVEAAVAGAMSLYDFAQRDPEDAQLLASFRREDLIGAIEDPRLRREAAELNGPIEAGFRDLAVRLFGRVGRNEVERVVFAVADLPIGALRRHLSAGGRIPSTLRAQLEASVRAALD